MAAAEAAGRKARAALMQVFAEQHDMTAREADVLTLLCQGRTRTYIAAELGISPNTVKGYIHNVYRKANAGTRISRAAKKRRLDPFGAHISHGHCLFRPSPWQSSA